MKQALGGAIGRPNQIADMFVREFGPAAILALRNRIERA
jgi:hypothetical protein